MMYKTIKLGLLTFLFFFEGVCHAQSLKVESFGEATNVQLVLDRDTVNDSNGDLCALIKVQIVEKNVSFEGGVSRVVKKGQNEWWVWISTQAKHLTIKSDSYFPLKVTFGDYGFEHLENARKQTYILRLASVSAESPKDKLARITVYDKDYKLLVGAEVKNKTTGYVYGTTRSDGTIAVNFDKKGEMTNVIVSHPSYSDTKEITVEAGVHDYKVYLRNYNPPKKPETPRSRKLKPEKHTTEISVIGGTSFGLAMDFTWSYFLIGFGVDWLLLASEQTTTSTLVNSGYTGIFTKTTTMNLNRNRTNVFLDMGAYFKYFSISCQVGLLCGTTIDRTSLYDGWGYGLKDGDDLDEYWGTYEQRSFTNTTSVEEQHLTFTPQIKGYIPVGSKKATSIAIGLGYTFIPSLDYNPGMSGSFGVHFRF